MKVMSRDDVFLIVDVKLVDMGIYSCTAKNVAGMIAANATLNVLGIQILIIFLFIQCYLLLANSICFSQNPLGLKVKCLTNKLGLVKKLF